MMESDWPFGIRLGKIQEEIMEEELLVRKQEMWDKKVRLLKVLQIWTSWKVDMKLPKCVHNALLHRVDATTWPSQVHQDAESCFSPSSF